MRPRSRACSRTRTRSGSPSCRSARERASRDTRSRCAAASCSSSQGSAGSRSRAASYAEQPSLFIELDGDVAPVREVAEWEGCTSFESETEQEARTRLWEARHNVFFALAAKSPGKGALSTDVAVPLSELPAAV